MSLKNSHCPSALKDTRNYRRVKKDTKKISSRKSRRAAVDAVRGAGVMVWPSVSFT